MRLNLFAADSRDQLLENVRSVKQLSKVLTKSVNQAQDLDFQIRNFYPFPLAYGYRQLSSLTTPQDQYRELLRVVENILAFLGSVSLSLALITGRKIKVDLVDSWQAGISPGHWRQVCHAVATSVEDVRSDFAQSLGSLWRDKRAPRFDKAIDELIAAKNDFKHDRGPAIDSEFVAEGEKVRKTLAQTMKKLGFLTDYRLQYIVDVNGIRNSSRVQVKTLAMVGDHPAWSQEAHEYLGFLTKGDIYLPFSSTEWGGMYPFLVVETCRQCKLQRATSSTRSIFAARWLYSRASSEATPWRVQMSGLC